jgi:hypothetical protein
MTHHPRHRVFRRGLMGIAAMLITLAVSICAHAAVSEGPVLTNGVAAQQHLSTMYHDAEQSFQEQLKVGRKRYNQMQADRANIIAAMSAQLQARQQTVVIHQAAPAATLVDLVSRSRASLAIGILAATLIGFAYYLKRPKTSQS